MIFIRLIFFFMYNYEILPNSIITYATIYCNEHIIILKIL